MKAPMLSWSSRLWFHVSPVLPLGFLLGWFGCRRFIPDERFFYLSLLASLATAVFVFFLRRRVETFLPILFLFVIFLVGHYVKFYWLVLSVEADGAQSVLPFVLEPRIEPLLYPPTLLKAFELSTWGYTAFCVAASATVFLRLIPSGLPKEPNIAPPKRRRLCLRYLWIAATLMVVAGIAVSQSGAGVLGREEAELPYKLGGIINYGQATASVLVGLVLAWADRKDMKGLWWGAMSLVVFQGALSVFVRGSRAFLIGPAISLGTLWLVYRRFTKARIFFLIFAIAAGAFLRPVFTVYRQLLVTEQSVSLGRIVTMATNAYQAYERIEQSSDKPVGPMADLIVLTVRIVGIDSVLYMTARDDLRRDWAWRINVLLGRESLARFVTQDVLGYGPALTTHFTSPSLVGALFLLGGGVGIVIGVVVITIGLQWMWQMAYRSNWWVSPVVLMTLVGLAFGFGSEGEFNVIDRDIVVMTCIFYCIEFFSRMKVENRNRG